METTNLSDIPGIAEQFFQCLHKTTIRNIFSTLFICACLGEIHATPQEQPCSVQKGLSHEIPREYIKPAKRVQLSAKRKGTALLH